MALGTSRRDVLRLVLACGLLVVTLGVMIGMAGSSALTRLLARGLAVGSDAHRSSHVRRGRYIIPLGRSGDDGV